MPEPQPSAPAEVREEFAVKLIFRAPINITFQSPAAREAALLVLAVARAAIISVFIFLAFTSPLQHLRWLAKPLELLAQMLFLPVYCLGKVLPPLRSPLLLTAPHLPIYQEGVVDLTWFLRGNVRAGVLAYGVLFHVPSAVRLIRGRRLSARVALIAITAWLALVLCLAWGCGLLSGAVFTWLYSPSA